MARVFYGWRIAAAGAGLQFLYAGLFLQAFGAYVAVLSAELGWSKTALSGGAALLAVEGALLGPALGWMVDRFGPRLMVRAGVLLFAAGFVVFARVQTVYDFYLAIVILAVGTSLCGYFPISVSLVHFFKRQRGRALSVMTLGIAAGGITMPLLSLALETWGWRTVAFASAALFLLAGWPMASVIRREPSEVGETVDGVTPQHQDAHGSPGPDPGRDFTAGEALRTQAFWMLGTAHGLSLLVVMAVNVHAISHMREGLGYSLQQASLFITLMTAGQAAGILLGAAMGDRWEKRRVAAVCMLAHMAGLLLLTFGWHPALLVGFALLHGVAWGLRGPFMQALRADYFGLRAIGMILGLSAVFVAIGQMAGPLFAGWMADQTGNYRAAFVVLAVLAGGGSVMFLFARKPA